MTARRLESAAYRLLALQALRHAGGPLSKGELAWQVRANHPTVTRLLDGMAADGLVQVVRQEDGSYRIHATERGTAFIDRHHASMHPVFGTAIEEHFRYGPRPPWLTPPS